MQPRANRSDGTAGHSRGFLVTHLFQLAQNHRFAKLRGQIQHRGPHLLAPLALFRPRRRRGCILQDNLRSGSVSVLLLKRYFPRQAFQVFHHPVSRYAIEECPEGSALGVVFLWLTHQDHKNVLHDLFGGPSVPGHAQREAEHRRLVPPVQERECLLITLGSSWFHNRLDAARSSCVSGKNQKLQKTQKKKGKRKEALRPDGATSAVRKRLAIFSPA